MINSIDENILYNKSNKYVNVYIENNGVLDHGEDLQELFEIVSNNCLKLLNVIKKTEEDFNKLSFFVRHKKKKNFENIVKITLENFKNAIIEIKDLWRNINKNIIDKNYEELNNNLRTYQFKYNPITEKLVLLANYYENNSDEFKSIDIDYKHIEERKHVSKTLYDNLVLLYSVLYV
ncbi:MAG: hypothetical protein ACOWWH_01485 [Eubacteriaceae bacterium]